MLPSSRRNPLWILSRPAPCAGPADTAVSGCINAMDALRPGANEIVIGTASGGACCLFVTELWKFAG